MSVTTNPAAEEALVEQLAQRLSVVLDEGHADDVRVLDVRNLTVITDFMIVASARSQRQARALVERVRDAAREAQSDILGVEGEQPGDWVLIDLSGVIVHIMQTETREFYQLEKLWEQGPEALARSQVDDASSAPADSEREADDGI